MVLLGPQRGGAFGWYPHCRVHSGCDGPLLPADGRRPPTAIGRPAPTRVESAAPSGGSMVCGRLRLEMGCMKGARRIGRCPKRVGCMQASMQPCIAPSMQPCIAPLAEPRYPWRPVRIQHARHGSSTKSASLHRWPACCNNLRAATTTCLGGSAACDSDTSCSDHAVDNEDGSDTEESVRCDFLDSMAAESCSAQSDESITSANSDPRETDELCFD